MKNKLVKKTTKLYRFHPATGGIPTTPTVGDPTNTMITTLTTASRVAPLGRGTGK